MCDSQGWFIDALSLFLTNKNLDGVLEASRHGTLDDHLVIGQVFVDHGLNANCGTNKKASVL